MDNIDRARSLEKAIQDYNDDHKIDWDEEKKESMFREASEVLAELKEREEKDYNDSDEVPGYMKRSFRE